MLLHMCPQKVNYTMVTCCIPEARDRETLRKESIGPFSDTHKRKTTCSDLYLQHGDDVPLSIKILNRKMPLGYKLIWEITGNSLGITAHYIYMYISVIFEGFIFCVAFIFGNGC